MAKNNTPKFSAEKIAQLAGSVNKLAKNVTQSPAQAVEKIDANQLNIAPKQEKKNGFLKGLLDIGKNLLPTALSFVPGAGPVLSSVAKNMLTTTNDPEWFEKYQGAGLTFADQLTTGYRACGQVVLDHADYPDTDSAIFDTDMAINMDRMDIKPTMAQALTSINWGDEVSNAQIPAILAEIRKATNNVLYETPDKYRDIFDAGSHLYAIYYALEKYITFAGDLPIQANTILDALPLIQPEVLNQTCGIRDSLKAYLQSTLKLPCAYVSYLRWRFGNMFQSDNTGRSGFISYDPLIDQRGHYEVSGALPLDTYGPKAINNSGLGASEYGDAFWNPWSINDGFISSLSTAEKTALLTGATTMGQLAVTKLRYMIDYYQGIVSAAGRAAADLYVAYNDHDISFTVDARHYDEKEYNLRYNFSLHLQAKYEGVNKVAVVKDSRIDMNAGTQALTMSTTKAYAKTDVHWDFVAPSEPRWAEERNTSFAMNWNYDNTPFPVCQLYCITKHLSNDPGAKVTALGQIFKSYVGGVSKGIECHYQGEDAFGKGLYTMNCCASAGITKIAMSNAVAVGTPHLPSSYNATSSLVKPYGIAYGKTTDMWLITPSVWGFLASAAGQRPFFALFNESYQDVYCFNDASAAIWPVWMYFGETNGPGVPGTYKEYLSNAAAVDLCLKYQIACHTALQIHGKNQETPIAFGDTGDLAVSVPRCFAISIGSAPLSYDKATISVDTLTNLHSLALRNLCRIDYKRKSSAAITEAKEEMKELMVDVLPSTTK